MPPLAGKLLSVAPGSRAVTVTPVSSSSAQGFGEGEAERLGWSVDGFVGRWCGDRQVTDDEQSAAAVGGHVLDDPFGHVHGSGDVDGNDTKVVVEVVVDERAA